MSSASKTNQTKQRLATSKSLLVSRKSSKKWRAKHLYIKFNSSYKLQITLRRFRTAKHQRSARHRQIVFSSKGLFGLKELAIKELRPKRSTGPNSQPSLSFSRVLVLSGLFGAIFFGIQLYTIINTTPPIVQAEASENIPVTKEEQPAETSVYMPFSTPITINIPAISLQANVVSVGLQSDGTLETPELSSNNVGWFSLSPSPGELGPTIMVGHVDNISGPSVFWNLGKLLVGDSIEISREDKSRVIFEVYSVQQFSQEQFPTTDIYADVDTSELRLITCGGTFNRITGRYSSNTVVFARIVT